jgi:hypothetical protein
MLRTPLRLTSANQTLDLSPNAFGELNDCTAMLGNPEALQAHMNAEGYLFLRGFHERALVQNARTALIERLAADGAIDLTQPLDEARPAANKRMAFRPDIAVKNDAVHKVVYGAGMMQFFEHFLGGPARHYDFTWIRAVTPGLATPPHMDIVYMGRGTRRLYTAWTPYGDVMMEMGGLIVLERSHRHDRLNNGYGAKDVDTFCENRVGAGFTRMGGGGNITDGGWLSKNPVKLRERLGGRWLTADYRMGDVLIFSVFLVHCSMDNASDRIRLTSDTRYQLASDPVDERWIGDDPIGHGPAGKRGMIC